MRNFRRLLMNSSNVDQEPPETPPKDWRLKCQGILSEGKVMNYLSVLFIPITTHSWFSPWMKRAQGNKHVLVFLYKECHHQLALNCPK